MFLVEGKANAMGSCGSALSAPAAVPIASSIVITILADLTAGKGDTPTRIVRLTRICQHATFRRYR